MQRRLLPLIFLIGISFFFFFFSFLALLSSWWIKAKFGAVSFDSILFTSRMSLEGVSPTLLSSYIKRIWQALAYSCVLSSAIVYAYYTFYAAKRSIVVTLSCLPLLFFIGTFGYLAISHDLVNFFAPQNTSTLFEERYTIAKESPDVVQPKRNVIVLVLESMENTFYSQNIGTSLIPHLEKLQNSNVTFKNSVIMPHTGWTTSALTAYTLGIPLAIPIGGNAMDKFSAFLPNATSIFSLLDKNGYQTDLIMGVDSSFGGIKNLFTTHCPNIKIYDKEYMQSLPNAHFFTGEWGYRDKLLYTAAQQILTNKAKGNKPFFSVIVTIDTHSKGVSYGDYPQPYSDDRDAFIAADHMAIEFVTWLKEQDFFSNTTLVILGDHLYMSQQLGTIDLNKCKRSIYNCFINLPPSSRPLNTQRIFTAFDIAPTLLEIAGIRLQKQKLGLGVSLFSDEENIIEQYKVDNLNKLLKMHSKLYDSFF